MAGTGSTFGSVPEAVDGVRERLPDYPLLVHDGAGLTLVGPPGLIAQPLDFHNGGDQRAMLRHAALSSPEIEAATGRHPGVLMPTVVLHPGQSRRVPLRVTIPDHTPPGRYDGELRVAGQVIVVVIHVVEAYRLRVAPSELILENRAGDRVVRQIVCTNAGNVTLQVGAMGAVLDDESALCRTQRAVAAAWPEEGGMEDAIGRFVDLLVTKGSQVMEHSGVLQIHVVGGPREILPGETEVVDLEIILPDRLLPKTRYSGIAALYMTNLQFRLVPVPGLPNADTDDDDDGARTTAPEVVGPGRKRTRTRTPRNPAS
jgi:hypothetical protein